MTNEVREMLSSGEDWEGHSATKKFSINHHTVIHNCYKCYDNAGDWHWSGYVVCKKAAMSLISEVSDE